MSKRTKARESEVARERDEAAVIQFAVLTRLMQHREVAQSIVARAAAGKTGVLTARMSGYLAVTATAH